MRNFVAGVWILLVEVAGCGSAVGLLVWLPVGV